MKLNSTRLKSLILATLALGFIAAAVSSADFLAQRRKFRDEIKNKVETKLDQDGNYIAVIFKGEESKYNFKVSPEDRARLKAYAGQYFSCTDGALLDKIVDQMNTGRFVVFKEFQSDGVNLKVLFLCPKAKYWDWLTDCNGIENMFHTYNFSVGLDTGDRSRMNVIIQTEGSFFGITQSVSLPVYFESDAKSRTFSFRMPSQKQIIQAVASMKPVKPGRVRPEEKFLDSCRTHPYFQQTKGNGELVVSDEDIMKLYHATVEDLQECPVKESTGHWTVQEDYPYLVVDYSLKTSVNVNAFIPTSMRFLSGTLEDVAQSISDEVSVKYLPLSMKNFRDFTQEWTRTGGPK
ncbi:MAG TPA: hypothetical protein VM658_21610 [bacterium]|nr:hypothetical protein [bacterium]